MREDDLLALMVAIMHATRFDRQRFGETDAVDDDIDAARRIIRRLKHGSDGR